jgi:peptidoglycan/LPS O-acetylase OafA/YrhL
MAELDSMRGIAILLVLFFHGMAPPLNANLSGGGKFIFALSQWGWVGVNLFFVLSGFLITGILIDGRSRSGYFRRFYIRRALRILPALYMTLILLLGGGLISWRFLALSVLFLANTAPLLGVPLQYGPLWSLAVEEHFYMLWPAIIRRFSPVGLIFLLTAIFGITPLLRAIEIMRSHFPADAVSSNTAVAYCAAAAGCRRGIFCTRVGTSPRRNSFVGHRVQSRLRRSVGMHVVDGDEPLGRSG